MNVFLPLFLLGVAAVVAEDPAPAVPPESPASEAPTPEATPGAPLPPEGAPAEPAPAEVPPALPVIGPETPLPADLTEAPPGSEASEAPAAVEGEPQVIEPPRRYPDGRRWRNGMPLLWIYSCGMGSATGMALGAIAADDEGVAYGFYLGGGAGALGMALLHPDEITLDQTALVASSGLIGGWMGAMAGGALIPVGAEREGDRIAAAGVLGAAAGTAIGGLVGDQAPPARVMLFHDLSTFAGWQVGGGIGDLAEWDFYDERQRRMAAGALGGTVFLGTSLLAIRADSPVDPGVVGLMLGHGSWIGMMSPFLVSSEATPEKVLGGMRLGLGAGYLAGVVLSPYVNLYPRSVGLQLGGMAAGNALGAGIPLALGYGEEARWVVAPMLAGSVAGQVAGLALAPTYEVSGSDALLMGTIETWALYQGLGWGLFVNLSDSDLEDGQGFGMGLAIAGGGTIVAGTLAPLVDFTPAEAALVGSGAAWGTWYGAWGGHLAGLSPEQHWLTTLVAGNAGLAGTAAIAGAGWDPGWRQVGLIDSAGLLGGTVGAMAGVIASPNTETVAAGSLVGSTAGLVAGAVLARKVGPGSTERSHALLIPLPRVDLPFRARVSAAPWLDEEGGTGALLSLDVVER